MMLPLHNVSQRFFDSLLHSQKCAPVTAGFSVGRHAAHLSPPEWRMRQARQDGGWMPHEFYDQAKHCFPNAAA